MFSLKTPVLSIAAAFALGGLVSACGLGGEDIEATPAGQVAIAQNGISIKNASVTLPPAGRDVTAAYFELVSARDEDVRIIAASSVDAEAAELHTHSMQDGMMAMRRLDGIDVAANSEVLFERGGLHVMLFGVSPSLVSGDVLTLSLTLDTDEGEEVITFQAPVVPMG